MTTEQREGMDWFVLANGNQHPAPDLDTIRLWQREGRVPFDVLVYHPTLGSWKPLNQIDPSRTSAGPSTEEVWYRRAWVHVFGFVFVPFIQIPVMWFARVFTKQTRWLVTFAGAVWMVLILASGSTADSGRAVYAGAQGGESWQEYGQTERYGRQIEREMQVLQELNSRNDGTLSGAELKELGERQSAQWRKIGELRRLDYHAHVESKR